MSLFSDLLTALAPKYTASVDGRNVRVSHISTGSTETEFNIGPGATHALMQGTDVAVFFRNGGVMIYSHLGGSFKSCSGDCK
jgi:hypothetical protein